MIREAIAIAAVLAGLTSARADAVADFYRDRTVNLYIGYGPGGGYDLYARMLAKHMVRFIPGNPKILPTNMPGASSMTLGN